ncbi:hypothetical protein QUB68_22090 [Microcoleus sp. A006_D1]|uniref:hypothetical protein n=1 Tax=Microcoleus sp. A006_D1 TaxID=3055267 RepID=UPI002FD5B96E
MLYNQQAFRNRQDACSTINNFDGFELKPAFRNRQDACSTINNFDSFELKPAFRNRQDACSTINNFSCGVGILPAPKQLLIN